MPATPTRTDYDRSRNPAHMFSLPEPTYGIDEEISFEGFFFLCYTPGLPVSLLRQIVSVVFSALLLRKGGADTKTDDGCPACR